MSEKRQYAHVSKSTQSVGVENKPGAATILAAQAVATAPPDGLTLCFYVTNVATNRFSYNTLPYKLEDLAPVAIGFKSTAEYDTAAKLVDYAKKNPGKLSYSTTGSGGATHLVGELVSQVAGIQAVAIHYKGAALV